LKLILTNKDYAALSRKVWLINGNMTPLVACTITAVKTHVSEMSLLECEVGLMI